MASKVKIIVYVEPKHKAELAKRAKKANQSTSEICRDILRDFLRK
jgi:hypothetical protein